MKSLIFILVLIGTSCWSDAYNYQRSSSFQSARSTSGLTPSSESCCKLSPWAYEHMDVVRLMADQLRQAYNARSRGQAARYTNQAWGENFANSIGKSNAEINAISRDLSDQIIADVYAGRASYAHIAQPNYFEAKAATALEKLADDAEYVDNQQQQVDLYEPVVPHYVSPTDDLSKFDEVKHYNYPTEIKVVNGQTFVTNKNCTTATVRGGSSINPIVTTVRVNRTTTHSTVPMYVSQGNPIGHPFFNKEQHAIYRHLGRQEATVPNYSPQVTVNDDFMSGMNQMNTHYTPPIVIPVEGGDMSEPIAVENQYGIRPGHTVTVRKYNRTIITGPDGRPVVSGSESKSVWDNGQLVYNYNAPFGNVSWTKDDMWKREERERLFWLFQDGIINSRELEEWQRNQEERLLGLAYRFNKTLEEVEEWQRQELDRYKVLVNQYSTVSSDLTEWQRRERGRLDWLIHQNGITLQDLERWQKDNERKLTILARQYHISLEELKEYHRQELNRLHVIFNQQNSQISSSNLSNLNVFQQQESNRLNNILLQHNSTVDQLQEQIRRDQDRYKDLAQQYKINVADMEKFFKNELARLTAVINQQQEEMKRFTTWQRTERTRLEDIVRHHNLTVDELEQKIKLDRNYLQTLAQKYHISMEELEKWQRSELDRLHETGKDNLQKELEEWQRQERARMLAIIKKNDLTIEEYESKIGNDRARLQQLASTYKVQVEEIEKWLKEEAQRLKTEGVFSEVQKNLTMWQQQERDRLQEIVQNNELTIEELQNKINKDQGRLYSLANTYQVRVEEVEEWLKKELVRLQKQGLIKDEDLQEWQKTEREKILQLIEANKLTVEDYEKKLLSDKSYLQQMATQYHVELKDIEAWLRKESDRLQKLGLIEEEKLTEWQRIERDRLLALVQKNELSIDELEKKIKADQVHLYSLAHRYSVRVEEIEEWLKKEVLRLQNQQIMESESLKDWQKIERDHIMMLVKQNDLTVDQFVEKIKTDRVYLQQLAMQYHVQIEEIEEWARNEGTRLESLGLIKPNAPLTQWQELERDHVLQVVQGQDQLSLDELEERLKNDRSHLMSVAQEYQIQVQEIEEWIRKELHRLQNQGVVQIEQLKEWQQTERDHLTSLISQQQSEISVDEFERQLKADRQRLQNLAYENNVQVKEIEEWIHKELARMKAQGEQKIYNLTEWQKSERDRLLILAQQHSDLSAAELEKELQADRNHLQNLAWQYHIEVEEVEEFIKKEVQRLRDQGKLHIENLSTWQLEERERLHELIREQSHLSVEDVEKQLKADRNRLQQLAWKYHIQVEEVEEWIRKEADRLRNQGELHIGNLTDWQLNQRRRIQQLIQQNSNLTAEDLEMQLIADQHKIQQLAYQYHVSVEEIEEWIKKELQRLRKEGTLEIEHLNAWQKSEKDRLLQLAHQQSKLSLIEFEEKLIADRRRLELLANQYHISVQEIEEWIKKEAERLENQGIIGNLKDWQKLERSRIQDLLQQTNLTIEEFQEELKNDHKRLQDLAYQYHVTVEEVEEWILKEGNRQIKPEALTNWQIDVKQRLHNLIRPEDQTIEEIERTIKNERSRNNMLALHYHVTVEEIEEYIRREGRRLIKPAPLTTWQVDERERILQQIGQPQSLTIQGLENQIRSNHHRLQQVAQQYHITVEEVEEWIRKEGQRLIQPSPEGHLKVWQQHEREHLLSLVQHNHVTMKNFEERLINDRTRLEAVARQFSIRIDEIIDFLRKEYQRLVQLKLISEGKEVVEVIEWHAPEQQHIQQLLQEHRWSIEELERKLCRDRERLQQLANHYHVTLEEIEFWYRSELQKLLQQKKLYSENLTDWQKNEKDRLYTIIVDQQTSIEELQRRLGRDRSALKRLADQYRVTIQELVSWQRKELARLADLGYARPIESGSLKNWQIVEKKRLRSIPVKVIITKEELLEYIESDGRFQNNLTANYEVSIEELFKFQGQELQVMKNEGLLEILNLNHLENWQRRERDRLYGLIQHQSFNSKKLPGWQTDNKITSIASMYNLPASTIRNWQIQEMQRIESIAKHYKMSLNELEDFRDAELERLGMISHKDYLSERTYNEWYDREELRFKTLGTRTGLSGAQLDKWRRKLYLLAQGLINLDFNEGGYGGNELNTNTSVSGKTNESISLTRGDQPPNVYQEEFDESEPKLGNPSDTMPPMYLDRLPQPSNAYLPPSSHDHSQPIHSMQVPASTYPQMGEQIHSQRTHTRKEYKLVVPVDSPIDTSYQNQYSLAHRPSYGNMPAGPMTDYNGDDMGQQTQVEDWNSYSDDPSQKTEKFEDYGQQQVGMGHLTADDLGQQQQQQELGHLGVEEIAGQQVQQEDYQNGEVENIHQSQQPIHPTPQSGTPLVQATAAAEKVVVAAEPVTEKPKSVWSRAKSYFGY